MSITRRGFLSGLGTSAAGAAGAAVLGPSDAIAQTIKAHGRTHPQRFSRMFPDLPSFAEATPAMRAALTDMGAPGGLMDAQDPLHLGPLELLRKPELSPNNRDNPTHERQAEQAHRHQNLDAAVSTSTCGDRQP